MDSILSIVAHQLKRFPNNLLILAAHPRIFLTKIIIADRNPVSGAIYLAIACFLAQFFQNILFFGDVTMWWARTLACSSLAFGTTMLCGFVMLVAWRLVGCSGKERTITTLYFYHSGTWNLFMSSVALTTASFLMQIENMEVKKAMLILFSFKEIIKFSNTNPELSRL